MYMQQKCIFAIILLSFVSGTVFAQQQAQFTHNMFNNMGINPGLAGMRNAICATGIARQQWVGFRDEEGNRLNPETYSLNVDAPIRFIRGGVALGFIQDQLGPEASVGVSLSYSYHLDMGMGRLGIGANVGFLDKRIDFSGLNPLDPGDPVLIGGEESTIFTDFSLGGFYMLDDEAWAGLSFTQLRQARGGLGESNFGLKRHVYAMGGYNLALPNNSSYVLSPSLLVKTDLNSFQFDINTLVTYNNRFWGGVTYRPQDAVAVMVGVKLDQISVGYSYDITTSPLGAMRRSYGTHEIMLQYCFDLGLDRIQKIQRNIRFL
ncbi:MAG: type IX secretion system membrane protein PorP/SprF [Bacteroidia bacterium]|nr:MAG: type IX secretion system membrane protein PorP/SprF [Bacteroidia bacterium]